MADIEERLNIVRKQHGDANPKDRLSRLSREWGPRGHAIVPAEWGKRNLKLKQYQGMESYLYAPELHDFEGSSESTGLKDYWDKLHPDDQRSLLEEESFKKKVLKRLNK